MLAEPGRAARDAPGGLLEAIGRAGVAQRPAELGVLDRGGEAARHEVRVFEGFLGRGWGAPEKDELGEWFRWSVGDESIVLLPLREPHRYVLSARVRPFEALREFRL